MASSNVIGLVGYAGSGKDTVARYMRDHKKYERVASADPIKRMVMSLMEASGFVGRGIHPEDPDFYDFFEKHKNTEMFPGATLRRVLQTLGTEWGRKLIDQDIWVRCSIEITRSFLSSEHLVVWTDVRFPNEADAVLNEFGGQLWYIYRPGMDVMKHESESHIWDIRERCSRMIPNTSDLAVLEKRVHRTVRDAQEEDDTS